MLTQADHDDHEPYEERDPSEPGIPVTFLSAA
jgi:hypothetical protein